MPGAMRHPKDIPCRALTTIAIAGVGLIGGSLAAAVRKHLPEIRTLGVGRDLQRLAAAQARGLIDEAFINIEAAAAKADLLVVCLPVDRIVASVRSAAIACRPGTLITDAGSVKGPICRELSVGLPDGVIFVGSHPLAGSEKQGFEHADAALFERRVCVMTPHRNVPVAAVDRIQRFWEGLGANVLKMSAEEHDRALAETSHLPHIVAAALAAVLEPQNARMAASGFRDTTRIAGGDPDLWTAILLSNADLILQSLQRFEDSLAGFRAAITAGDAEYLKQLLADARSRRIGIS
jgi:prephenate dehydrogenase